MNKPRRQLFFCYDSFFSTKLAKDFWMPLPNEIQDKLWSNLKGDWDKFKLYFKKELKKVNQ